MNTLIEKGMITEMTCGSNFAYVLDDNNSFLATEYKVLQSQSRDCFVRCMRMLYNGRVQMYYLTGNNRPLTALFPTIDEARFVTIVANLLADIIEVKSNGFLSCKNIDISFEHIYVDPATYKVRLVYLPLNRHMFEDDSYFENELRTGLIKLISGLSALSSHKMVQLSSDLSNGAMSLEDLYNRFKGNRPAPPPEDQTQSEDMTVKSMRIVSLNAPSRVEINITKNKFILGKKSGQADGVLSFNDKISRKHCKIENHGNRYMITDLRSTNGTFVNHVRLQPEQPYPIKNGDVIRLANSEFQIVM